MTQSQYHHESSLGTRLAIPLHQHGTLLPLQQVPCSPMPMPIFVVMANLDLHFSTFT
jgi:hypothetical protein